MKRRSRAVAAARRARRRSGRGCQRSLGSLFCGENRLVEARAWKVLSFERRATGALKLAEMLPLKAVTGTTDGLFLFIIYLLLISGLCVPYVLSLRRCLEDPSSMSIEKCV